jgi:hypothetical protein
MQGDLDIIFLSYDEPNRIEHFERLRGFAPHAQHVTGITGIYNAFRECARVARTERFFLVDADSWIVDGFVFRKPPQPEADFYVWPSRNAVNDLVSLNGCLKLLTKAVLATMRPDAIDVSASARGRHCIVRSIAVENRFNATPYLAWRGAFRECALLAAGMAPNPHKLLPVWQHRGADRNHGLWCLLGARQGAQYGAENRGNRQGLARINDVAWLSARFDGYYARVLKDTALVPTAIEDRVTRSRVQ